MDEPLKQSASPTGGPPPSNLPTQPAQPPRPPQPLGPPQPAPPPAPQPLRAEPSLVRSEQQKRPYLEHLEVRTMEKDALRIREEEARKEQQRIAELKALKEAEKERAAVERIRASALATRRQEETQQRENLRKIQDSILPPGEERRIRNLPPPPSAEKKVFVRLLVVIFFAFIALNLVGFTAWYFFFRDQATPFAFPEIPFISQFFSPGEPTPPVPPPLPMPEPTSAPPTPVPEPQDPIAQAINPAHFTTLQFSEGSDLSPLLSQILQARQKPNFTQLLFRNTANDTLVANGVAFFRIFGVNVPESVVPHLSGNSFFFVYSYARGNRFGMIVETPSPTDAARALEQWKATMEQTLNPVLSFWAPQKTAAYTKVWRSTAQGGIEIHFQTFSLQDYGMVYAVADKYVIIASSHEATKAAIQALQATAPSSIRQGIWATLQNSHAIKPPPSLSPEQALGQIFMIGINDATLTQDLQDTMRRLQPGGVLLLSRNIQSVQQLKQLTEDLQRTALDYSSLPLLIAVDQEGGTISRIKFGRERTPQSIIENVEHAYQVGQQRAEELKFLGINLNLSPVLDSTNPNDFLFDRTFQAGRLQAGTYARALLAGQKESGILSTVKHFPGYGNISFNPEKKLAALKEFPDISPFVFALPAKPEFLLTSHVIYAGLDPDVPFSFSPKGISLIRSDLNFQGIILTDDLNQPALLNNYGFESIVASPMKAGVNMLMFSEEAYATKAKETLWNLMQQDTLLKKNVEDSAAKILELKKEFFFGPEPKVPFEHLSHSK